MERSSFIEEENWLLRLQQGDERIYKDIFLKYYASLCIYAETFIADAHSAEDVVEEIMLQLWERGQLFNSEEHLKAFLYHSIRNACFNALKRNQREGERQFIYLNAQDPLQEAYLSEITRTEAMIELYQAIATLPTQAGKIIRLTYLEGRSNQEAADLLGLSVHTIKAQKQRGLAILRERIPGDLYLLLVSCAAFELFFHSF